MSCLGVDEQSLPSAAGNPPGHLSHALRHLNGVYTQAFNRRHRGWAISFRGRYKAIVVEKEAYLLELCRYVVLNPVRAKMVTQPRAWKWSSYRATAGMEEAPPWLTVDWVLGQFARTRRQAHRAYQQFVAAGQTRKVLPWERVQGQIYLGGEDFLQHVPLPGCIASVRGAYMRVPNARSWRSAASTWQERPRVGTDEPPRERDRPWEQCPMCHQPMVLVQVLPRAGAPPRIARWPVAA